MVLFILPIEQAIQLLNVIQISVRIELGKHTGSKAGARLKHSVHHNLNIIDSFDITGREIGDERTTRQVTGPVRKERGDEMRSRVAFLSAFRTRATSASA
jgi:hypothetical protein